MTLSCTRRVVPQALGWLALACATPVLAITTCTVSATPMAFGSYDTLSSSPVQVNSTVTISCMTIPGLLGPVPYMIALGPSSTTGTMSRAMVGPSGSQLQYNLHTSVARNTVWGDGSGGSQTVPGSVTPALLSVGVVRNHTVYGAIPAQQLVRPGTYLDSILVTVDY